MSRLGSDKDLKEIFTGSFLTFVFRMGGMFVGYLVILYISNNFGAEGMGIYSLTISVITLMAMLSGLGFNMSVLRYVGQFNKEANNKKLKLLYLYVLEITIPLSLIASVSLYMLSEFIATVFFNDIRYRDTLKIASFIIPFFSLFRLNVEYIRGLKDLKVSELLRSLSIPLVNILFLLIMAYNSSDPDIPLYSYAIATFFSLMVSLYYIYKRVAHIQIDSRESFKKRELVNTSIPMLVTMLSTFIMGDVSLWLLQSFTTAKEVGVYNIALKISVLISLVLMVVNTIAAPKFSELYWAKEYTALKRVIAQSTKLIFLTSLFLAVTVILFRETILGLFGEEFIIGGSVLILLVFAQLFNALTGSVGIFLSMTGQQKILRNIIVITMVLTIVLNYIVIPIYGMNGAAFVFLLSSIIANVSSVYYVKTRLGYVTFYIPDFLRRENGR